MSIGALRNDAPVEILDYRAELRAAFESLNREWLEQQFSLEEPDRRILKARDQGSVDLHLTGVAGGMFQMHGHFRPAPSDPSTHLAAKIGFKSRQRPRHAHLDFGKAVIDRPDFHGD